MSTDLHSEEHLAFLRLALDEAKKCIPTPTAFCVGCVITASYDGHSPVILSTGYSRELPGNTHAEANALAKLHSKSSEAIASLFSSKDPIEITQLSLNVYSTLEPCSVRTSGLAPCCDALIAANIKRCFIGVAEPDDFVNCEGAQKLKNSGAEVIWLQGAEEECLRVARTGH